MKVAVKSDQPKHPFLSTEEEEESSGLQEQLILFAEANFQSEVSLNWCVWKLAHRLEFSTDEALLSNPVFTGTNTIDHLISVVQSDVSINTKCAAVSALGAVLERMTEADQESLAKHDVTGYIVNLFRECDDPASGDLQHIITYITRVANLNQCACGMILSHCPFQRLLERARELRARGDANFAAMIQLIEVISYSMSVEDCGYSMSDEDCEYLLRFAIDMLRATSDFSNQATLWLVGAVYYMARHCPEKVGECQEWIDLCFVLMREGTPGVVKHVMNMLNCLYETLPTFHCDCYSILVDKITSDRPAVVQCCVRLIKRIIQEDRAELKMFLRARMVKAIATCMKELPFSHKMSYLRLVRFLCRQGDVPVMKQFVKFEVYANLPWECTEDVEIGKLLLDISEHLFCVIGVFTDPGLLVRLKSQYDSADVENALRQISEQSDAKEQERIEALMDQIDGIDIDEILSTTDADLGSSSDTEVEEV